MRAADVYQALGVANLARVQIFSQPFRPLFLGGACYAATAMLVWLAYLHGDIHWQAPLDPKLWHAREMLFGFCGAILMGFLLTAITHWTGLTTISAKKISLISLCWVLARLCFLACIAFSGAISTWLVIVGLLFECLWWGLSGSSVWVRLKKSGDKRNRLFPILLLSLLALNLVGTVCGIKKEVATAEHFLQIAVMIYVVMLGIVGGRVIPFFISRVFTDLKTKQTPRTDKAIVATSLVGVVAASFFSNSLPKAFLPGVFVLLAGLHAYRLVLWANKKIIKHPMLWSLLLAYSFLVIGLVMSGLDSLLNLNRSKDFIHFLAIGAIGFMMLAMIYRVALGHTNQPIVATPAMTISFACIFAAVLLRALLAPLVPTESVSAIFASGLLWICAFVIAAFQLNKIFIDALNP